MFKVDAMCAFFAENRTSDLLIMAEVVVKMVGRWVVYCKWDRGEHGRTLQDYDGLMEDLVGMEVYDLTIPSDLEFESSEVSNFYIVLT